MQERMWGMRAVSAARRSSVLGLSESMASTRSVGCASARRGAAVAASMKTG